MTIIVLITESYTKYKDTLMNPEIWPEGVKVREYTQLVNLATTCSRKTYIIMGEEDLHIK